MVTSLVNVDTYTPFLFLFPFLPKTTDQARPNCDACFPRRDSPGLPGHLCAYLPPGKGREGGREGGRKEKNGKEW